MDLTGARTVQISYAGANGSGVTADAVPLHPGDSEDGAVGGVVN
jgi:hypothetical protein